MNLIDYDFLVVQVLFLFINLGMPPAKQGVVVTSQ